MRDINQIGTKRGGMAHFSYVYIHKHYVSIKSSYNVVPTRQTPTKIHAPTTTARQAFCHVKLAYIYTDNLVHGKGQEVKEIYIRYLKQDERDRFKYYF